MAMVRKAGWFVVVAVMMAGWMGVLGSVRGVAEAGVIASTLSDTGSRVEDMAKVQSFLENKVVVQKLVDYGVSPAEAMAKVQAMSAQDLHRLAALTDRAAAGTDSGTRDPDRAGDPRHPHHRDLQADEQGGRHPLRTAQGRSPGAAPRYGRRPFRLRRAPLW